MSDSKMTEEEFIKLFSSELRNMTDNYLNSPELKQSKSFIKKAESLLDFHYKANFNRLKNLDLFYIGVRSGMVIGAESIRLNQILGQNL